MSENQWIWQCDRVIPSDTGVGREVMEEVIDQLESQHWIEHDIFSVRLAMEEALINAIRHGNRLDANKQVHICCGLSSEVIRIEITDEGEGFDLSSIPDPTSREGQIRIGGRGVMLIRHFMSRVEYNDSGNMVVMEKEQAKE